MVKYVPTYTKGILKKKKEQRGTYQMMLVRCFLCFGFFLSNFLYKSIICGYSFALHQGVDAIQIGTHNICLYKEVDKNYTGCNQDYGIV